MKLFSVLIELHFKKIIDADFIMRHIDAYFEIIKNVITIDSNENEIEFIK